MVLKRRLVLVGQMFAGPVKVQSQNQVHLLQHVGDVVAKGFRQSDKVPS